MVKVRDEFHQPAHGYQGLEGYVSKQTAESGGSPASDLNLQSLIGTENWLFSCLVVPKWSMVICYQ